jgi:hypothetical protein
LDDGVFGDVPICIALLLSLATPAREFAVISANATPARQAAVARALASLAPGDVVIPNDEAEAIAEGYASACKTDVDCLVRAGVAGSVDGLVVVGPGDTIAWVDVAASTMRARPLLADTDAERVLGALLFPDRFGDLELVVTPTTATVTVDGQAQQTTAGRLSLVLPVGHHAVAVQAPGNVVAERSVELSPRATVTLEIALTPTSSAQEAASPLPVVAFAVGGSVFAVGVVATIVGELQATSAISAIQSTGVDHGNDLRAAETLQGVGIVLGGVGLISIAAGVALGLTESAP